MENLLVNDLFQIKTDDEFDEVALSVFKFQYAENEIYHSFINFLKINPLQVKNIHQIPFLPIAFFKTHQIVSGKTLTDFTVFSSSGTTGMQQSKHFVSDISVYAKSYLLGFEQFYGNVSEFCVLALLPNYLEREGSSLIYMAEDLIKKSTNVNCGFFLYEHDKLYQLLLKLKESKQKTLLIGVSFALLDFIEKYQLNFPELIVMETGGMKGKRKELLREELHQLLKEGFGVPKIHSEYGMTELLSQAYSTGDGVFNSPPWMKILIRDTNDPFTYLNIGKTGGINIIDLANINSCSFLATQDLGKLNSDHTFEILGRFDNSDIRGCNLMVM